MYSVRGCVGVRAGCCVVCVLVVQRGVSRCAHTRACTVRADVYVELRGLWGVAHVVCVVNVYSNVRARLCYDVCSKMFFLKLRPTISIQRTTET